MFGYPTAARMSPIGPVVQQMQQQADIVPQTKPVDYLPPRQPGFMSRISSFFTPERLRIIGAGLRDLGTGGNTLPALLQQLDAERARLDEERWRRVQMEQAIIRGKRQDAQDAQEAMSAQQAEALIASLPPDEQALARLNPQAYVAGIMRHRYPAPSRARSSGVAPSLPDGFVWED